MNRGSADGVDATPSNVQHSDDSTDATDSDSMTDATADTPTDTHAQPDTTTTDETAVADDETVDVDGTPAIVAKRADESPVDTEEIVALTEAAGYAVVDEITQVRAEEPGSYLGGGKVETLVERARETGARLIVVDAELTPAQSQHLAETVPDETRVFDRYRLVLDIFADQAETQRAQLQVELARLKYALPRIKEDSDEQAMNRFTESGTRYYEVRDRIDELQRKLDALPEPGEQHRKQRREQGFDLVAVAGYTNAGKSTLLHRLADDLDLGDVEPDHPDEDVTAAIEDRLFKTLETTTRKATIDGRSLLLTDTVGFVQDLPHWLVESFSETLSESAAADTVVLVADASDPIDDLREKIEVSLDVLDAQGVDREDVVTAVNKIDLLDEAERERRLAIVEDLAPNPVALSVTDGENVDGLTDAILAQLPTEAATLELPNCDEAMSVVSWAYDKLSVESVDYAGDTVELAVEGRPDVVEQARAKARAVDAE
jgi:GTP-binding protein HflX